MHSRVQKWGNSLALRIPKAFALEVGLSPDSDVEVTVLHGKVVVSPLRPKSYSLSQLLSGVKPGNRHAETDLGPSVGREAW